MILYVVLGLFLPVVLGDTCGNIGQSVAFANGAFASVSGPGFSTTDGITVGVWVRRLDLLAAEAYSLGVQFPNSYPPNYMKLAFDATTSGLSVVTGFGFPFVRVVDRQQSYVGTWVHWTTTVSRGQETRLYKDGVAVSIIRTSVTVGSSYAVTSLIVGGQNVSQTLNPSIAGIRVFTSLLSATSVKALVANTFVPIDNTVLFSYSFNGNLQPDAGALTQTALTPSNAAAVRYGASPCICPVATCSSTAAVCDGIIANTSSTLVNSIGPYTVASIPYKWITPSSSARYWPGSDLGDDTYLPTETLPFDFFFFGYPENLMRISSNMLMIFDVNQYVYYFAPPVYPIPSVITPNAVIGAFWSDMMGDAQAAVYLETVGSAPNRIMVVTWDNFGYVYCPRSPDWRATAQIQLFESDSHIEVHLKQTPPACENVRVNIGIEDRVGMSGAAFWNNVQSTAQSYLSASFTPVRLTGSTCALVCSSVTCQNGATCTDTSAGFSCGCARGFAGRFCEYIDYCLSQPCQNGASCVPLSTGYSCVCVPGYSGLQCQSDIDECASNPCANGGTCRDLTNTFTCSCAAGYSGNTCQTEIDECASSPCFNGAICVNGVNKFSCECAAGYSGTLCQTDIDECASNPCVNGGTCQDRVNGFYCACTSGWGGPTCSWVDTCTSNPCVHGQCALVSNASYVCNCDDGYGGPICNTVIDPCASNPCFLGTCVSHWPYYNCTCSTGASGHRCEQTNACSSAANKLSYYFSLGVNLYMYYYGFSSANGITLSAWVLPLPSDLTGDRAVVATNYWKLRMGLDYYNRPSFAWYSGKDPLPIGVWSHLVGVANNAEKVIKIYVNGVLVRQVSESVSITGRLSIYIGGDGYMGSTFNGFISQVRMHTLPLSSSQISRLYQFNTLEMTRADFSLPLNSSTSWSTGQRFIQPEDANAVAQMALYLDSNPISLPTNDVPASSFVSTPANFTVRGNGQVSEASPVQVLAFAGVYPYIPCTACGLVGSSCPQLSTSTFDLYSSCRDSLADAPNPKVFPNFNPSVTPNASAAVRQAEASANVRTLFTCVCRGRESGPFCSDRAGADPCVTNPCPRYPSSASASTSFISSNSTFQDNYVCRATLPPPLSFSPNRVLASTDYTCNYTAFTPDCSSGYITFTGDWISPAKVSAIAPSSAIEQFYNSSWSFSTWVRVGDILGKGTILAIQPSSNGDTYRQNTIFFGFNAEAGLSVGQITLAGRSVSAVSAIGPGWNHVVAAYDITSGTLSLFSNGRLVATKAAVSFVPSQNSVMYIGQVWESSVPYSLYAMLYGDLAHLLVYENYAFSLADSKAALYDHVYPPIRPLFYLSVRGESASFDTRSAVVLTGNVPSPSNVSGPQFTCSPGCTSTYCQNGGLCVIVDSGNSSSVQRTKIACVCPTTTTGAFCETLVFPASPITDSSSPSGLSNGAIAGAVIGSVVGAGLLCFVVFKVIQYKRQGPGPVAAASTTSATPSEPYRTLNEADNHGQGSSGDHVAISTAPSQI